MKSFLLLFAFCLMYLPFANAAFNKTDSCKEILLKAESKRNETIYDTCGFNDRVRAFTEWAPWAEQEKAGQALYEICVRFSGSSQAERICQKAVELENGPAIIRQANRLYDQQNFTQAAELYAKALSSPLLTNLEKGKVAENMGMLYMNPESNYYNPTKGMPLIQKAIDQRGALANNLMGVYSMFGMQNVEQNAQEAFKYLWRSALLGCPAAEENLGLFYLAHQKKISNQILKQEMAKWMFSCNPTSSQDADDDLDAPQNCQCSKVLGWQKNQQEKPYKLVSIDGETAVLTDENDDRIYVEKNTSLSNGMKVLEIRSQSVVLSGKNFNRILLELAPEEDCLDFCQKQIMAPKKQKIPTYRFTFTQKECSDILYYAERLVDTKLPFVGKKECGFSGDMDKTTELLKNL